MSAPTYAVPARIETERLVLRQYEPADADQLVAVVPRNIAHLERYMEWIAFEPQTLEQRREWITSTHAQADAGEDYTLGIFDRDGTCIGGTGFHVRTDPDRLAIGYWIDGQRQGEGLVTEAAAALTLVGLLVAGADIVDISCAPSNARSAAVAERLGFERQARSGEQCFDGGLKIDSATWFATRDSLSREPLASAPRPDVFDADGATIPWPA